MLLPRPQNNPIYLKSYIQVDDQLKFHYIVHCALDSVEEKGERGPDDTITRPPQLPGPLPAAASRAAARA